MRRYLATALASAALTAGVMHATAPAPTHLPDPCKPTEVATWSDHGIHDTCIPQRIVRYRWHALGR